MKKVLFITEYLNPPYDEGIKKTVYNLFLDLDKRYELQVICRFGFDKDNIHIIETNPLFYSEKVKLIIERFNPHSIIYLPFQSSTFASYLRLKVLSVFAKKSKMIFIALQPKPLKNWQQLIVKFIKPKFALTPSPALKQFWDKLGVVNKLFPLLTDLSIFKPAVMPCLAISTLSCLPNHCRATAKQVKLDMVAPVTKPPIKSFGRRNKSNKSW